MVWWKQPMKDMTGSSCLTTTIIAWSSLADGAPFYSDRQH